ncbi:MAG: hypothetical protein CSA62_00845 [Planctomycetota bacterium]|nr:MAG: hypothetical protein CSA62_00845 [Planctomycetota bacterium]
MKLEEAYESVLLGESLTALHERHQHESLGIEDPKEARKKVRALSAPEQQELHDEATRFLGSLCRLLGDKHAGEDRIAAVLRTWAERSKDYEAFDALLCMFEFPGRRQVLAEGKRLFPRTLTEHWSS